MKILVFLLVLVNGIITHANPLFEESFIDSVGKLDIWIPPEIQAYLPKTVSCLDIFSTCGFAKALNICLDDYKACKKKDEADKGTGGNGKGGTGTGGKGTGGKGTGGKGTSGKRRGTGRLKKSIRSNPGRACFGKIANCKKAAPRCIEDYLKCRKEGSGTGRVRRAPANDDNKSCFRVVAGCKKAPHLCIEDYLKCKGGRNRGK